MGDFYELFFEDAIEAAKTLDITLTKRGKHNGKDIPMCGVPVHSHETYLSRLITAGFKVAICEQTEDPAQLKKRSSKSLVERNVVRVITPGTITEDTLLNTRRNNYLAALSEVGSDLGLAWFDISTGEFRLEKGTVMSLISTLTRLEPGELLLSEQFIKGDAVSEIFKPWEEKMTLLPPAKFDSLNGENRLQTIFGVTTLDGFGKFSRSELAAGGALVDYLELTQMGKLPRITTPTRIETGEVMDMDQATRRNLELTQCLNGDRKGSLLSVIDNTLTGAGARTLAMRLSAPLTDPKKINKRLDAVEFFSGDRKLREDLRRALKNCPDLERALSRLTLRRGGPRDLATIRDGLIIASDIKSTIKNMSLPELIKQSLNDLGDHNYLVEELRAALSSTLPFHARDGGIIASGYSKDLDKLRSLRDESRKLIASLQNKYCVDTKVQNLKIKHNNVLGYFIEVTTRHADRLINTEAKPYIHRQTMKNAVRFTTVELGELEGRMASAAEKTLAMELSLFETLVEKVFTNSEAIALAAKALASLDVATALGELAVSANYCRPIIDDSFQFEIIAGRHAVVEEAVSPLLNQKDSVSFVANNCSLTYEKRLWLLTGPNMAGKSTFLRQNAIITILAQMGSFVPAEFAHLGSVDRLFSRVGAADDLARGRSTFMVEMVETAAILSQATERSFVILDEIGRGTATFDGLSIAWAVVEHLHEINKCRGLFATHYHELTNLTAKLNALACYTMRVKEWKGDVIFLHEVYPGAADRSYGIHVGRLAGLPMSVIERAQEILSAFEKENRGSSAAQLANDLPLFTAGSKKSSFPYSSEMAEELARISPDDLSPRDALELVYRLKKLAETQKQ